MELSKIILTQPDPNNDQTQLRQIDPKGVSTLIAQRLTNSPSSPMKDKKQKSGIPLND